MEKICTKCKLHKDESEFFKSKHGKNGLEAECKKCKTLRIQNGPNRSQVLWRSGLKVNYNLTEEQYDILLESQGGVCASCKSKCARGRLSVDHDHRCCPGKKSCGTCVRGLLCRNCNVALGNLRDSPDRVRALLAYIVDAES